MSEGDFTLTDTCAKISANVNGGRAEGLSCANHAKRNSQFCFMNVPNSTVFEDDTFSTVKCWVLRGVLNKFDRVGMSNIGLEEDIL